MQHILVLIFLISTLIVYVESSDYIITVTPTCATSVGPSEVTTIQVVTDIPSTQPYATCKDDNQFMLTQAVDGSYTITAYYAGDSATDCLMKKSADVETYSVDIYVPESQVHTYNIAPRKVICNYADTGTGDTDTSSLGESLKPINEVQEHMATVSESSVSLCVADVLENCISGRIRLGKTIMLKAELIGNFPDEQSFQALSCKAYGGGTSYPVLIGGCGDGIVIRKNQGFTTTGKIAKSPFFKSFRLPRSRTLSFDCVFVVCSVACDGTSCDAASGRKKRDLSYVEGPPGSSAFNQHIQHTIQLEQNDLISNEDASKVQEPRHFPISSENTLSDQGTKAAGIQKRNRENQINVPPELKKIEVFSVHKDKKEILSDKMVPKNDQEIYKISHEPIQTNRGQTKDETVSGLRYRLRLGLIFFAVFTLVFGVLVFILVMFWTSFSTYFLKSFVTFGETGIRKCEEKQNLLKS